LLRTGAQIVFKFALKPQRKCKTNAKTHPERVNTSKMVKTDKISVNTLKSIKQSIHNCGFSWGLKIQNQVLDHRKAPDLHKNGECLGTIERIPNNL